MTNKKRVCRMFRSKRTPEEQADLERFSRRLYQALIEKGGSPSDLAGEIDNKPIRRRPE